MLGFVSLYDTFQRLAAYLPGLPCPYRQAGLCTVASTAAKESRLTTFSSLFRLTPVRYP
jgi:hypothetical protein